MRFRKAWRVAVVLMCSAIFGLAQANNSNGATSPPPEQQSQQGSISEVQDDQGGGFVFKKEVEEVVLHAVVVDSNNHLITNLQRQNFVILEDGKPQQMTFFRHEDVPVALGILVDNSGSMRPERPQLSQAALKLVEASQARDRVFVVNFGDQPYLDQDFTGDVGKLKLALDRTETQGSTALYDAVVASAEHLEQGASHEKKILLIITDGRDNASQESLTDTLRRLQTKAGPVIYAIALGQTGKNYAANRQAIASLCQQSGGAVFFPTNLSEVQSIAQTIGRDVRSQYVIGYKSSNPSQTGVYHAIAVRATYANGEILRVSTRKGYYSGSENAPQ